MSRREADYQRGLKKRIEERFPGCYVLKNDPNGYQGIPDLTVLWKKHWATLECKRSMKEVLDKKHHEPNQDFYVERMNEFSFSSFICPENEEEVLNGMERLFKKDTRR